MEVGKPSMFLPITTSAVSSLTRPNRNRLAVPLRAVTDLLNSRHECDPRVRTVTSREGNELREHSWLGGGHQS